jgi:hypothetical protein
MEFPVSAVHIMQVTGRDEFLLIVSLVQAGNSSCHLQVACNTTSTQFAIA